MKRVILGSLIGAIIGYVYYRLVGCSSGSCPLSTSQWAPMISIIYGIITGLIITSIFTKLE